MAVPTPAWKRLGLKLKYAKDEPRRPSTAVSTRKHDQEPGLSERPAKRARTSKNLSTGSPAQNGSHISPSRGSELEDSNTPKGLGLKLPVARKKSVTFSEETKQDDGDSRVTIDFPADSPGSTPKKSKKLRKPSPEIESPESSTPATDITDAASNSQVTPTKQASKAKAGKMSKGSRPANKDKSSSALHYLTLHRSDRESWKFNKILDVWILSHAIDSQAIPSTHVPALAGYVRGLPTAARSRTRLVEECHKASLESQLEADTVEADRTAFLEFVDSQRGPLKNDASLQEFVSSHSRPAILLWALNEPVSQPGNSAPSSRQQGVLPARKKKSRTAAPVDISSSSETDSDSDSSDDSSDSEAENKISRGNGVTSFGADPASKDNTSSSGNSSSSLENESEDSSSSDSPSSKDDDSAT